jgi:hypothetical protein
MVKMIRQTSLESWRALQPKLGLKQMTMYQVFAENPEGKCTDRDLSKILGWAINSVTARRNELWKQKLIVEDGTTFDEETKRRVTLWKLKTTS